eukprot:GEZU01025608.1.p1 GENE.GEZU01025608.1~~GEZU01025608.1.p1  ORF type:complete len:150 (+),score=2.36 GEZU01025608.1:226-675(+)
MHSASISNRGSDFDDLVSIESHLFAGTSIAQLRSSIPNVEELEDTPLKCIINVYTQWGKTVDPLIAYTSTESESSAASSSSYLFLQGTALLNVLFVAPTQFVGCFVQTTKRASTKESLSISWTHSRRPHAVLFGVASLPQHVRVASHVQ